MMGSKSNYLPPDQNKEYWTTSRLEDEFFLCLTKVEDKKYYQQAKELMYRIPLTEQHPKTEEEALPFKIKFSDLPRRVQEEFTDYCKLYDKRDVTLLLKRIVIRLFENLNYDYAHSSVMKKLRVSLQ
jgi:hypothetical protein